MTHDEMDFGTNVDVGDMDPDLESSCGSGPWLLGVAVLCDPLAPSFGCQLGINMKLVRSCLNST